MSDEEKIALAEKFYQAFADKDSATMASCYADDVNFHDPAFGALQGKSAKNMWHMLLKQADKDMKIMFNTSKVTPDGVITHWEAFYKFSKTGRLVHNKIRASMQMQNGKITQHIDTFNIWKWSGMALGLTGWLLGFTPLVKNKIRQQATSALSKFESHI